MIADFLSSSDYLQLIPNDTLTCRGVAAAQRRSVSSAMLGAGVFHIKAAKGQRLDIIQGIRLGFLGKKKIPPQLDIHPEVC